MSLKIEANRILNSIRLSESDSELDAIRKWVDLFESHYNDRLESDKLRVAIETKRDLMPKLEVTIKDISTIESLVGFVGERSNDEYSRLLSNDGNILLERFYDTIQPLKK